MDWTLTVEVEFDAGHQLPKPPHDKPHGHHYRVAVSVSHPEMDPRGMGAVADERALHTHLSMLRDELHERDLNAMIAPAAPTSAGVASWFMERLTMHYPVTEVRVWWAEDRSVSVHR